MPDPGVHLAQVNCALNGGTSIPHPFDPCQHTDAFQDLCSENGVTGYPQMNLYHDGEFVESYNADREFHLLVEYLTAHAESKGVSEEETDLAEDVPAPAPISTAQDVAPTPTLSPIAKPLVVQNPHADANPSGTVVSLDVQTFDNFLTQGPAFIKFFAPW